MWPNIISDTFGTNKSLTGSHDTVQGKQHKYANNRCHNPWFLSTDKEKQLHTGRNWPQSSHLASVSAPVDDPRVPELPPDGRGDPALHRDRIHTLQCHKFVKLQSNEISYLAKLADSLPPGN